MEMSNKNSYFKFEHG